MIPTGMRNDSVFERRRQETGNCVGCTSELEGPCFLEDFGLEEYRELRVRQGIDRGRGEYGGLVEDGLDEIVGFLNGLPRELCV